MLDTLKGLPERYAPFASQIAKQGWVRPNKRIFNNAKISDHFAIVPTGTAPKSLSEAEAKIYDLVVKRFLSVFFPAAEYLVTTRITRIGADAFKTEGKILVNAGWLAIHGKEAANDDDDSAPALAPVQPGEVVETEEVLLKPNVTKPPARYNEATLLSAMEGAGKLVDDEDLREAMGGRGSGHSGDPAPRSSKT